MTLCILTCNDENANHPGSLSFSNVRHSGGQASVYARSLYLRQAIDHISRTFAQFSYF